jgi:hypothetical protein
VVAIASSTARLSMSGRFAKLTDKRLEELRTKVIARLCSVDKAGVY